MNRPKVLAAAALLVALYFSGAAAQEADTHDLHVVSPPSADVTAVPRYSAYDTKALNTNLLIFLDNPQPHTPEEFARFLDETQSLLRRFEDIQALARRREVYEASTGRVAHAAISAVPILGDQLSQFSDEIYARTQLYSMERISEANERAMRDEIIAQMSFMTSALMHRVKDMSPEQRTAAVLDYMDTVNGYYAENKNRPGVQKLYERVVSRVMEGNVENILSEMERLRRDSAAQAARLRDTRRAVNELAGKIEKYQQSVVDTLKSAGADLRAIGNLTKDAAVAADYAFFQMSAKRRKELLDGEYMPPSFRDESGADDTKRRELIARTNLEAKWERYSQTADEIATGAAMTLEFAASITNDPRLKRQLNEGVKKVQLAHQAYKAVSALALASTPFGYLSAAGSLTSALGGLTGALGTGSDPNEEMRENFGVINQKLDFIIELQKQTLQLLIEFRLDFASRLSRLESFLRFENLEQIRFVNRIGQEAFNPCTDLNERFTAAARVAAANPPVEPRNGARAFYRTFINRNSQAVGNCLQVMMNTVAPSSASPIFFLRSEGAAEAVMDDRFVTGFVRSAIFGDPQSPYTRGMAWSLLESQPSTFDEVARLDKAARRGQLRVDCEAAPTDALPRHCGERSLAHNLDWVLNAPYDWRVTALVADYVARHAVLYSLTSGENFTFDDQANVDATATDVLGRKVKQRLLLRWMLTRLQMAHAQRQLLSAAPFVSYFVERYTKAHEAVSGAKGEKWLKCIHEFDSAQTTDVEGCPNRSTVAKLVKDVAWIVQFHAVIKANPGVGLNFTHYLTHERFGAAKPLTRYSFERSRAISSGADASVSLAALKKGFGGLGSILVRVDGKTFDGSSLADAWCKFDSSESEITVQPPIMRELALSIDPLLQSRVKDLVVNECKAEFRRRTPKPPMPAVRIRSRIGLQFGDEFFELPSPAELREQRVALPGDVGVLREKIAHISDVMVQAQIHIGLGYRARPLPPN